MRQMPFPDSCFDVVVSSWAVHNLESSSDREKAFDEIMRVMKPGARVIVSDIVNQAEYAAYLRQKKMGDVRLHNNPLRDTIFKLVTFGSFAPSAVSANKPA